MLSNKKIIEIAKDTCMMHRTSKELGFIVMFDNNDLKKFVKKIIIENNKKK